MILMIAYDKYINKQASISPVRVTIYPWLLSLGSIFIFLQSGYSEVDNTTVIIVISCVGLMVIPSLLFPARKTLVNKFQSVPRGHVYNFNLLMAIFGCVSIVGTVLESIGYLSTFNIDYSDVNTARGDIKALGELDFNRPIYMRVGILLSKFWGAWVFLGLLFNSYLNKFNNRLFIIIILIPFVLGTLSLGRTDILAALFIMFIAGLLRLHSNLTFLPKRRSIKYASRIIIISIVFFLFAMFNVRSHLTKYTFSDLRYGLILDSNEFAAQLFEMLPVWASKPLYLALYYVDAGTYHLSFMLNNTISGPYYGLYNIPPMLSSQLEKIGLLREGHLDVMEAINYDYQLYGLPSKVFYTSIGNFIFDFSIVGTLLLFLIIGIVYLKVYRRYIRLPEMHVGLRLLVLMLFSLFSPMFFVYGTTSLFLVGLYCLVLSLLMKKYARLSVSDQKY